MPYIRNKVHAVGANQLMVNRASEHVDAAMERCLRFCLDTEVRSEFLQVSSVPAYDPLPIVSASPGGTSKTIALINLSRIAGMSSVPPNTKNVVLYSRWYGRKASAFTQQTITNALSKAILGNATVKQAFTESKQAIDHELKESG